jgi:hypothetical protein
MERLARDKHILVTCPESKTVRSSILVVSYLMGIYYTRTEGSLTVATTLAYYSGVEGLLYRH